MKYCPTCKTMAADDATVCTKCGAPVRRMGAAPPEPAPPPRAPAAPVSTPARKVPPPTPPLRASAPAPAAPVMPKTPPAPVRVVAPSAPPVSSLTGPLLPDPPVEKSYGLAGDAPLSLELQGLQHAVAAGRRRVWLLGLAAALLMFLLVSTLIWRHFSEVFQYAETAEVEFRLTNRGTGVEIAYVPKSTGRLQIARIGSHQTEQLTEFIEKQDDGFRKKEFLWDGPDTPTARFVVTYRRGWSLREQIWSPSTAGSPR